MRSVFGVAVLVILGATISLAGEKVELKDEKDNISYSVGYQMGGDFKRQGLDIQPEAFLKGIQDALGGTEPLMSSQKMRKTLVELKKRVTAAQGQRKKAAGEKNLAEGEKFLADNAGKDGVTVLASGLQYQVVTEGEGDSPAATDTVTVHYRGTLLDGTEFDSSYGRGQPATFQLNRVIKGWTEGLQLMKPGAKYKFFIPPDLAYGERGAGANIGPNSTLIFEVELLEVK